MSTSTPRRVTAGKNMGQAVDPGKVRGTAHGLRVAQLSGLGKPPRLQPVIVENWPKSLSLGDFRKVPEAEAREGILSTREGKVSYRLKATYKPAKARLGNSLTTKNIRVAVVLAREHTWVMVGPGRKLSDVDLLHHEQGHYDIGGLVARELGYRMRFIFGTDESAVDIAVRTARGKADKKAKLLNENYDNETNHGQDSKEQRRWDDMIRTAIEDKKNLPDPK